MKQGNGNLMLSTILFSLIFGKFSNVFLDEYDTVESDRKKYEVYKKRERTVVSFLA